MDKTVISMNGMTAYKFNGDHWCVCYGRYGKYVKGFEDTTDFTAVLNLLTNGKGV